MWNHPLLYEVTGTVANSKLIVLLTVFIGKSIHFVLKVYLLLGSSEAAMYYLVFSKRLKVQNGVPG